MISVKLSDPWEFPDTVRQFREDICRCSGFDFDERSTSALSYALYLFAFTGGDASAAGMLEFFFFRDARAHGGPVPSILLQKISPAVTIKDVVHVGSLAIREDKRNSRVLTELCRAFVNLACSLGVRVVTVGSSIDNRRSAVLQSRMGLRPLGSFEAHGSSIDLSYCEMAVARERVARWDRRKIYRTHEPNGRRTALNS